MITSKLKSKIKMLKTPNKVCIVSISLAKGGAERSVAMLTQMLTEKGHEVHLVILNDEIDYEYSGEIFNLGKLKSKNDNLFSRLKRFVILRSYIKQHDFDYIIDNRGRRVALKELFYLKYIYRQVKVIYLVRSFYIYAYFPKNKFVAKKMIQKAIKIVGVSKAITDKINITFKTQKAITIYNPVQPFAEEDLIHSHQEKYILFLGRIDEYVKNLTLLLESYKLSKLAENNVVLKIIGDGDDKELIIDKIKQLDLENQVEMIPFTAAVFLYLKNALFLTLTSRYEGFPRVLIEALSVGVPVISVNCKSGPDEIIIHEKNGLLVENHNPEAFADAMNRFILDKNLYQICKSNSKESVAHLNKDTIGKQWTKLLKDE